MKNINNLLKLNKCFTCGLNGFFCYTPSGADYNTCPCCGNTDFLNWELNNSKTSKYDFLLENEYDNDIRNCYSYCEKCKIIFELGCKHAVLGCTDDVFNCHFIKRWKINDSAIIYEGMPQFDNSDDWFENVNKVQVLEMYCPHNNAKCVNSKYDINTNCNCTLTKK